MKLRIGIALAFLMAAPFAASAQSQDEQNACIGDAFSVCGHAIPDRDRVAACLADNIDRISPSCRTVMARYPKPRNAPRYTEERRTPRYQHESRYSHERPQDSWRYDQRRNEEPRWYRGEPGDWRNPTSEGMR